MPTLKQFLPTWLLSAALTTLCFESSVHAGCANTEYPLCLNPSIGPTGGETRIVVTGLQGSSSPDFPTLCSTAQSWRCFFVLGGDQRFSSSGSASIDDCNAGQIRCSSPAVTQPNDYLFFVVGSFPVSGKTTMTTFPTTGALPQFSYFGTAIQSISPISGTVGFKTAVEVQLFNAKSLDAFLCRFIPRWYVSSWEHVGWSSSMSFTSTTTVEDMIDGQLTIGTYPIPQDRPAGFVEENKIQCTIPDDLILDGVASNATLWLEVAEQATASGISSPTFTKQRRRFIVYKAPNVTSGSVKAAPYTSGSVITIFGRFFDSLGRTDTQASAGGLKCRFLWCFDYSKVITCKTTPFLTGDFINSTTAMCKTAQYYPGDPDCDSQCRPGGSEAGYRLIDAITNLQYRRSPFVECCGDTCCSEEVQIQLALNGVEFIPSTDRKYPKYTWVLTNPRVMVTMYSPPALTSIFPPAVPLQGATVTIFGQSFVSASRNYTLNTRFCIFGGYSQHSSSIVWTKTPMQFISDSEVTCTAPSSIRSVQSTVFLTFNAIDSQSSNSVRLSYYSITRVNPSFGSFLGGTVVNVSGQYLDSLAEQGGIYTCRFTGISAISFTVAATLSTQGSLICVTPSGSLGDVIVSVSLNGVSYSEDNPPAYFRYVEESMVNLVDPNVGPQDGGFLVRVVGSYFINSSLLSCRFSAGALDITVSNDAVMFESTTSVVCRAPAASVSGLVSVYILNNGQQGSLTFAKLTYFSILYVAPDGGLVTGGTNVTITLSTNVSAGWCRFASEVVPAVRTGIGQALYCITTASMSTSAIGSEVPFAISLNNRDFATSPFFRNFTFYMQPNVIQLIPESGPQRGSTIVTVRGNGFFSLCRTGQTPAGDCYKCSQEATTTFTWTSLSSCRESSLKIQSRRPCGQPCRPGLDDRLSFGLSGKIYCKFGKIIVLAKYKTPSQIICVSPPSINLTVAVRSAVEVSLNDLQFSESDALFSYYEITGLTPSSGPTYGETVISIEGQNLFAASQIACLFWINIVKQGTYDSENDVILCPAPEQPIELRDNDISLIQFKVSLNSLIADQYTTTILSFQYYQDAILSDMSIVKGPMNAKFLIYLKLPFSRTSKIDFLHQATPYQYAHTFSQTFLNTSLRAEQPAVCFGTIVVHYLSAIGVTKTCCDDEATDEPCDGYKRGLVSMAIYKNASFLAVSAPSPSYGVTGDVEIAWNGFIRRPHSNNLSLVYNPTAQYTRRTYCQPTLFLCMQESNGQRCESNTDCDSLTFRFWAIYSIFPVAVSVKGGTDVDLIGDNFPYPSEDSGSQCVFFRLPVCNKSLDQSCNAPIEFARTQLNPIDNLCDVCTSFDPGGNCLSTRFCSRVRCKTPSAPNGIIQQVIVEIYYPSYPLTNYRLQSNPVSKLFYYLEVSVSSIDISAGPDSGGTQIIVRGSGFINSPSLYCQFAVPGIQTFSADLLWTRAVYVNPGTLNCTVPACTKAATLMMNSSACRTCASCNLLVLVTVNSRDFANGVIPFYYRSSPQPLYLFPKRAPYQTHIKHPVTISGFKFPNVGSQNAQGFGLSCSFGQLRVKGFFDANCSNIELCDKINCIPPFSTAKGAVEVAISIDGQQYVKMPGNGSGGFSFFSITEVFPPLFPGDEVFKMLVVGVKLDQGLQYVCRFQRNISTVNVTNSILYSNGSLWPSDAGTTIVNCPSPPAGLSEGAYAISLSLDGPAYPMPDRDYSTDPVSIDVFEQCQVTEVLPTKGRSRGGILVTVKGRRFRNTTLLACLFGAVRGETASYINESMVICTMPQISGAESVFVEVSFNGQDFSRSKLAFAVYQTPIVSSITPASLPVGCSRIVSITGSYFRNFESFRCRFWNLQDSRNDTVRPQFRNSSAVFCQVPPCTSTSQPCTYHVLLTLDGIEFSKQSVFLHFYQVQTLNPIDGPIYGGTPISVHGQNLQYGVNYKCLFLARDGLNVEGSVSNAVYGSVIDRSGYGYEDGTFDLVQTSCSDSVDTIYSVKPAEDVISSEDYGIHYVFVNCTAPCNGSGLLVTYTNLPNQIPVIDILDRGTGYSSANPPILSANNGRWHFIPKIGNNCLLPDCCENKAAGRYTVYNGSIVTVLVIQGGANFSADNPPTFSPNGCDGQGGGSGCMICYYARYVPSGSCNGTCECEGNIPRCSSGMPTASCQCSKPLAGATCLSDANCTGNGKCIHSALISMLVANVTSSHGRYNNESRVIICDAPPVTSPSYLQRFQSYLGYPWNGVPTSLLGLAPVLLKLSIHDGEEYTTRNLIFRYLDPPIVTNVTPNSASSRGGTRITILGSGFRKEEGMSTYIEQDIRRADSYGPTDGNMKITCRLHDDLPSMPGTFVNSTFVICITNRVCFQDSTMSDCSGCITEGCAPPNSSIFATDTFMGAGVSMNEYDFEDGGLPFYVYSVTSFRPFGGTYDGGTHVTIAGINFDRGGSGPYDAHCKFSRIIVPATFQPEFGSITCVSGPLLDVLAVLEIHLGADLDDSSLYTDNGLIFYYYTAYPGGLTIVPDSGTFRGNEAVSFQVPQAELFNVFRFRSLDFNSEFKGISAKVLVLGARDDSPGILIKLDVLRNLVHDTWNSFDHSNLVQLSDIFLGERIRINDTAFDLLLRIEPVENVTAALVTLQKILVSSPFQQSLRSKTQLTCNYPRDFSTYSSYSDYGAFARFGTTITPGSVASQTTLRGTTPGVSAQSSTPTMPVYFSMNGQQFSLQPLNFYFYSVSQVSPFGVPFTFGISPGTTNIDYKSWIACPDNGNLCPYTVAQGVTAAIITVYGNNFQNGANQASDGAGIQCIFGDVTDTQNGVVGIQLDPLINVGRVTVGTLNADEGYVLCQQPSRFTLRSLYDEAFPTRRVRVEVSLNGRDYSYSFLNLTAGAGIVLYREPQISEEGASPYSPFVGPLQGGTVITVSGKYFREDASPETTFCLFTDIPLSNGFQDWMKVPATVTSSTSILCASPPFDQYGYGYAASTFTRPPQEITIYVTMNNFHWHRFPDPSRVFSFFDILKVSPIMSSAQFSAGSDATLSFSPGNFLNPEDLTPYCWWDVPGIIRPPNAFVVQGQRTAGSQYVCPIPDWSLITINNQPATRFLPCNQSFVAGTNADCNFDGRLTVKFGIAFLDSFDPSRKQEFSFGTSFSFYALPKFKDFLPKMGDQDGGTEIHIYGENFLDVPALGCKFSEGATAVLAASTIYVNSSHVICVTPPRNIKTTVNLYLTLNGVAWYTCLSSELLCTLAHPYYGGATTACCAWQDSITKTQKRLSSYSYAARPTVSSLLPDAAPTRGDTNINVIGNNIVGNVQGSVFACLVGDVLIKGAFVTNGGLQYLTCLTQPNMKVGDLNLYVSLNGFEWSSNFQVLHVFSPLRAFRISPSFTVWDNPIKAVTVVGVNFIIPAEQVGSMLIRLVEFDAAGVVRWKKDVPPIAYGNELADAQAPSLTDGIVVDTMTFQPPKRDPCTTPTSRFCEPGVVNVYISQNEGTEWTWENVTFAYVRTPNDKTRCYLDYPVSSVNSWCGIEAIAINRNSIWDVQADPQSWKNLARIDMTNNRGVCTLANASDFFGQSVTTGKCVCTAGDCRINAYDCGDKVTGALYLGCSIKAAITEITPRSGPQAGGTIVTIRGFKLNKGSIYWCKFGSQAIIGSFNSTDALIRCRTPASEMNGSVEVEVSISNGEEWTDSHGLFTFHYYFPPTIMGFEPSIGPASGGTNVIVTAGYTDSMIALGTLWRSLDVDQYGIPTCRLTLVNGLCAGMYTFGSYTDYGPITPGLENYCVWEPHCRFQLYQQHRLACEFSHEASNFYGVSTEAVFLSRNVIQCTTPKFELLMDSSNGITNLNVIVRVTIDGQLWFDAPNNFQYHAITNISLIRPEVGPVEGGIWVSLVGTGFIYSDQAICFFGNKPARNYRYVSSTVVVCESPQSGVLQQVSVGLALNGIQVAFAAEPFQYVGGVSVVNLIPRFGQEVGGTLVNVIGLNFVDSKLLSCKFGGIVVGKPKVTYISSTLIRCEAPRSILPRYPWQTNKSYSGFVTSAESCVGHFVPGSTHRRDLGWTVCANCTDCCKCLDCPECRTVIPPCRCDFPQEDISCAPNPSISFKSSRSLCLPPEFRCFWAPRTDPTFSQLQCELLNFTGKILRPPQPVVLILQEGQYLHPDLALRQTVPFYTSLDGQTWISGCVQNPQYGIPPGTKYSKGEDTCLTNDPTPTDKWTGTYVFTEKYNVTKFKPDIAPIEGKTIITIVGEGFQSGNDIRCKFGYFSIPDFFDADNPCDAQGNLTGVVFNEVPATFVDSFTVICLSPPVDLQVHRIGLPPVLANGLIDDPPCAPYSKNPYYVVVPTQITINGNAADYATEVIPFYYSKAWSILELKPSKSPTVGGIWITVSGPYFLDTEDILCKFGELHATAMKWISSNVVLCRTPSVKIHQFVNVSITLDGQSWSDPSNTSLFEFDGVRNLMIFGENDYGQLGFGVAGQRLFSGYRCVEGKIEGFSCISNQDCPSGICQYFNQTNLNLEPTFLDTLFAHNITGIAMGQTHTMIISSQTYNDSLGTLPRRGVVYVWGGNLVGQLGLGFSGPSRQYDLTTPSVLVCRSEDIYILDVRIDSRPILGLPPNFPSSTLFIPTCVKKQDVYSQGVWYIDTVLVYNPFYEDEVVRVAAGSFHSLALTKSGKVYSWGWNNNGQLGLGPLQIQSSISYPSLVFYFLKKKQIVITKIAAGFSHSAAVSSDGILYTWGNNKYGQLAQGDYESRSFPTAVENFKDSGGATLFIDDVKCGLYHCIVLTKQGQVWSFGSNSRGQLGTCASFASLNDDRDFVCPASPIEVGPIVFTSPILKKVEFPNVTDVLADLLGAPKAIQIATGAFHSLAITVPCASPVGSYSDPCPGYNEYSSDLYVWGNNRYGQLGLGTNSDNEYRPLPMLVPALFTISSQCNTANDVICVAGQYTDGCCHTGSSFGQLGVRVKGVGAGSWHTIFYVEQLENVGYSKSLFPVERMFSMGNNDEGQLGLGDRELRNLPTLIRSNFVKFHEVGGGYFQSLFTLGCPPADENVCNGNGLCYEQGVCECYPGYRGKDCSIECDGGAKQVCSNHGNATLAFEIAAWRRTMIKAASGRRMKARIDNLFEAFQCTSSSNSTFVKERFETLDDCAASCKIVGGSCTPTSKETVSSAEVVNFLQSIEQDYPIMQTAVRLIVSDWPLMLFLQGVTQWRYSYQARADVLSASTQGPSHGRWKVEDITPMVHMIQDRATCWRTYNCPNGMCAILRGETRTTTSVSGLEAGPGCRDGWTARIAFRTQIRNIDRVWANLEIENRYCDPQKVADLYGLQKEQVQYIWSALSMDFANITVMLFSHKNSILSTPFINLEDPVATVEKVWTALDQLCNDVTISEARDGCLIDGACVCDEGWTGLACDTPCSGGVDTPCNFNGVCRDDGMCDCDRGWTGPTCSIECEGARNNSGHFPCNLHGSCNGWYMDPQSMYDDGPPDFDTALYYSAAKGVSVWYMGTSLVSNGSCRCYYGFRSPEGKDDCSLECPGTPDTFLGEYGECFDHGLCNGTGSCQCYEGYRNYSCNVECLGGHLHDVYTGVLYSNECTSQPVCDVYPNYIINTITGGTVLCKDQDPYSEAYSKDYKISAAGQILRVYNGLCQFDTSLPRDVPRQYPIPECPGPEWCDPSFPVAGPGGMCDEDERYCVEFLTRTKNYTGQPWSSAVPVYDPIVGGPPGGCPHAQCAQVPKYMVQMGYPSTDQRFHWHPPSPDVAPHHSTVMGRCYCLPGFRGKDCSLKCPGAYYGQQNLGGSKRPFPTSLKRTPNESDVFGADVARGWDSGTDGLPDGVAGRALVNICSGNGYCEEDATCSCFLTDAGPHTNYTKVSGWRGEACETPCQGGPYSICSGHGICDEVGNCTCFKGYRNASCEIECKGLRDCEPTRGCHGVCNYAGVCGDDGACICDLAYRGPGCELICPPWDGVVSSICSGPSHGRCDDNARCVCIPIYEGENCQNLAAWLIFLIVLFFLVLIFAAIHVIRRYMHARLRQKRRARRERRKVKRTQAAVGRLRTYTVTAPDASSLEAKGL